MPLIKNGVKFTIYRLLPKKSFLGKINLEQALFLRTSASSAKRCTEAAARRVAPSDQPYQADSDGSGHDMVWLDNQPDTRAKSTQYFGKLA